ncbi:hypothetical protein, partial [Amycolatopsis samaneae]
AFGPRRQRLRREIEREKRLGKARILIGNSLLSSALVLLAILVISTVLLGVDSSDFAPELLITIDTACVFGAIGGLLMGCAGLTLVIIERNQAAQQDGEPDVN